MKFIVITPFAIGFLMLLIGAIGQYVGSNVIIWNCTSLAGAMWLCTGFIITAIISTKPHKP
jgi:hypothetical protein